MLITFANVSCPWWSLDSLLMRRLIHALPALGIVMVVVRLIQVRRGAA
jgi:hypothetical protein